MAILRLADYALHQQSGSNVPGKVDANPFMSMSPVELREMIKKEPDPIEKKKMISALKQFERECNDMGQHPWAVNASVLRVVIAYKKVSELVNPAINIPYYQDSETPQGHGEVLDSLMGLYDNDNNEKLNITRQGIRPKRDIDTSIGGFLNPKESPFGESVVKPRGDGPDPDNMDYPDPPTGGDSGCF